MSKLKKFLSQGIVFEGELIAQCFRGNPFSGRLWQVHKSYITHINYISLMVYKKEKNDKQLKLCIGYHEDTITFNYVDCPLKYLDMVKCPKNKNAAQWRQKVYEYHNNRIAKRLAKNATKNAEKKVAKALLTKKGKDLFNMMFWSTPKQYPNVFSKYLEKKYENKKWIYKQQ